ncbi:Por secretion system C-terminal sorting domain-containing protein [Chitinophaga sp. YR627]|uniref:Ig-like domain-containing protein n=1 Tax=Chitinophaga sp. YR627 TaxID=1881041 RepID=UPI0008DF2602|nr:Ig-like domain-containing protein [Chitinophaga sp. YR627]SFM63768.1 Por secretion system C-terminal sorting domain-containing protein [Chitinophaga sp. YR627]
MKNPVYPNNKVKKSPWLATVLCLSLLPVSTFAQRTLVWEESFTSSTLNAQTWTYETGDGCAKGNCGWGNAELEYYTNRTENVRIENGHLVIEARREDMGGKPFTSGRIKTAGRVTFRYGSLEARIKVPKVGNGLWPAFWLLGATGGTWPHNGEVDILEMGFAGAIAAGRPNNTLSAATHWWTENPGGYTGHATYAKDTVATGVDLSDDYHLYKLEWDPQFLTIYLDNSPFYKIGITGGNGFEAFHNPFYILLNLAVGGNYPGIHSAAGITAPLPGRMEVDYIRLYQDRAQGEELILASNNAPEGNYGIFTDNTTVSDRVAFGQGANLYLWNNITNITSPAPAPFEGSNVWAFHANAGAWYGLGVANDMKNMSNYSGGSLKFHMKTSSTATFKVGIASDGAEGWINFNGSNEHGLVRDGQWHEVTIPVSEFGALDLMQVTQLFMFSGDAPVAAADFYFDNIYYTGGVSANPAPKVAITNIANEAVYTTPAAIAVQTNASDPNGSISKVDFYNGAYYLGTTSTAPFNYTWNTSTQGIYKLIAKATDNQNKTTTSQPVTVLVAAPGNTAPQISITSPTASTPYRKPAKVVINTNVTDNGIIYKVEFFNGSTLLATLTQPPYNYTWENVPQGTYTITAKATDNGKLSTTSAPVTITVQDNKILSSKYGIYSEDASITEKMTYGLDANLYIWNNLATISGAAPYEGSQVIGVTAAAGSWFGLGVAHDVRDLTHFANGSLKFHFKTSYQGQFRFSIISQNGEQVINYAAGEQKLGLLRDGQWHEVTIPVSSLTNVNLTTMSQAFTFSGDAPAAAASFYIDNIYYVTSDPPVTQTNLALNKPTRTTSNENIAMEGKYAVDGNINTRWSSGFGDPQSIRVDLGADYDINRVKITWETAAGKDYVIQVSNDTINWTPLRTVTNNSTLVNEFTGLTGHGRYLRIYGTARTTVYGYSIFELEAYGSLRTGSALLASAAPVKQQAITVWKATLYPNPVVNDRVQLLSNEAVKQIRVVDLNGRTWSTQQLSQEGKVSSTYGVDVSRLPAGVYFIQLKNSAQQTLLLKFVKQ